MSSILSIETKKVTELEQTTTVADTNLIPVHTGSGLKKITFADFKEEVTEDTATEIEDRVTETLGGQITTLNTNLTSEINSRTSADTSLSNRITTLNTNLSTETTARTSADTTLSDRIDTLSTNLTTETNARTSADTTLSGRIDTLDTNLTSETTARTSADITLSNQITTLSTNLSAETTSRTSADTALSGRIDTLNTNLTAETTSRTNSDTALSNQITVLSTNLSSEITNRTNADIALTRRNRRNITSDLTNLCTAISEQNLEKYGYSIGDYFMGPSGYQYNLGDMNTYYGGYSTYAVVNTNHCGIVVDTKSNTQWNETTPAPRYEESTLHTFLTGTVLTNIQSDLTSLFGDYSSHLLSHQILSNGIGTWGWVTDQYISALTEVQVYSSKIWSGDNYQQGEGVKPLEIFQKFRFNEIVPWNTFWLRSLYSSSHACIANYNGYASYSTLTYSARAVGLILFH